MSGSTLKRSYVNLVNFTYYTSLVEPKNAKGALNNEFWIKDMQEKLEQFVKNNVWTLFPKPNNANDTGLNRFLKIKLIVWTYC